MYHNFLDFQPSIIYVYAIESINIPIFYKGVHFLTDFIDQVLNKLPSIISSG